MKKLNMKKEGKGSGLDLIYLSRCVSNPDLSFLHIEPFRTKIANFAPDARRGAGETAEFTNQ